MKKAEKNIFVTFFKIQDIRELKKKKQKYTPSIIVHSKIKESFRFNEDGVIDQLHHILTSIDSIQYQLCHTHTVAVADLSRRRKRERKREKKSQIKRTEKECAYSERPLCEQSLVFLMQSRSEDKIKSFTIHIRLTFIWSSLATFKKKEEKNLCKYHIFCVYELTIIEKQTKYTKNKLSLEIQLFFRHYIFGSVHKLI